MKDKDDCVKDPAFGEISISRVSGNANLFMVDYPQMHFMNLKVRTASLRRNLSSDWVFGEEIIVELSMSETQWARLISSPNTSGVPCTLEHYTAPKSGKFLSPKMPKNHVGKKETFTEEVRENADEATEKLTETFGLIDKMLSGSSLRKGDLQAVREALGRVESALSSSIPFVVQQAEEAIQESVESGKAEINAHADYVLQRIGERALGEHLALAIKDGADPKEIGRTVIDAISKK